MVQSFFIHLVIACEVLKMHYGHIGKGESCSSSPTRYPFFAFLLLQPMPCSVLYLQTKYFVQSFISIDQQVLSMQERLY